jgi:F-type H+-transporting ATPase subunit b
MKQARVDRDSLLKEARDLKNSIVSQAKDEAKFEAQKIIESANEAIKNEKNAAVTDIKKQVASLSIEIAEKLLKEKLSDDNKQMQIVEELLKDVKLK